MIPAEELPIFTCAARGDRESLAIIRDGLIAAGGPDCDVPRHELAIAAEVMARLTAEHGQWHDRLCLAAILLGRAADARSVSADESLAIEARECALGRALAFQEEAARIFDDICASDDGEAIAVLVALTSHLAEQGDEDAALTVDQLVANLSPSMAAEVSGRVRNLQLEA